jgi:signal transduction histidine kinase
LDYSDNLHQISKLDSRKIQLSIRPVNVLVMCWNVKMLFEHILEKKQIHLQIDVNDDIQIMADELLLTKALNNLVDNAVKFTPRGGNIVIRAGKINQQTYISVCDTGVGIMPEILSQLFSQINHPHTSGTNGERGLGLGLTICKKIMDAHGFSIEVKSDTNLGTQVTIGEQ